MGTPLCTVCGERDYPGHAIRHVPTWALRNQVKALKFCRFLNTREQEQDLEDAQAELRRRAREGASK